MGDSTSASTLAIEHEQETSTKNWAFSDDAKAWWGVPTSFTHSVPRHWSNHQLLVCGGCFASFPSPVVSLRHRCGPHRTRRAHPTILQLRHPNRSNKYHPMECFARISEPQLLHLHTSSSLARAGLPTTVISCLVLVWDLLWLACFPSSFPPATTFLGQGGQWTFVFNSLAYTVSGRHPSYRPTAILAMLICRHG